jgi:hypothetical protein
MRWHSSTGVTADPAALTWFPLPVGSRVSRFSPTDASADRKLGRACEFWEAT